MGEWRSKELDAISVDSISIEVDLVTKFIKSDDRDSGTTSDDLEADGIGDRAPASSAVVVESIEVERSR